MQLNVTKEIALLERMTVRELRHKYADVFGEETKAGNKPWLIKRIAWRMQSLVEGDISERARQRAAELANDADVRLSPPRAKPARIAESKSASNTKTAIVTLNTDSRLPVPGTLLTREYKQRTLQVKVRQQGFEYEGEVYKSLSAVAKAITGQHCNGFHFFRLNKDTAR